MTLANAKEESLLQAVLHTLEEAGRIVRGRIESRSYVVREKKTNDFVTSVDLEISEYLREHLPNAKNWRWLSEENITREIYHFEEETWVVDPIDGTRELIHGVPEFAISVALVRNRKVVLGVVVNPMKRDYVFATRDHGCYLNGEKICVRKPSAKEPVVWAVSRTDLQSGLLKLRSSRDEIRPMGSIAYKLALVAAGKIHGTFSISQKNLWDYAAGAFIVQEAGGRVVDFEGQELLEQIALRPAENLIACHTELVEHVTKSLI